MAKEIDRFLVQKFCDGFREKQTCQSSQNSMIRLKSEFEGIYNLLNGNPQPSSWSPQAREALYSLNDAWTEGQKKFKGNLSAKDPLKQKVLDIQSALTKVQQSSQDQNGSTQQSSQNQNGSSSSQLGDESSSSRENKESRWSSKSIDESKVYGLRDEGISLQRILTKKGSEDSFKAIGIYGIAGIGKTTLAQFLLENKEVKDWFFPRIWVCMSRQPDEDGDPKVAILKRMLLSLGVEKEIIDEIYSQKELKGLLNTIHLQLLGKRYLIVFDDARDSDEWYGELKSSRTRDVNQKSLASGLPKGYGGSVIVTSRDKKIAEMMVGEENLRLVVPLSNPDDCWRIFRDAAAKWMESSVEEPKKEFFKKCAGHPLTAKMMGQIYDDKQASEGAGQEVRASA